jgi:hypothetical protein
MELATVRIIIGVREPTFNLTTVRIPFSGIKILKEEASQDWVKLVLTLSKAITL